MSILQIFVIRSENKLFFQRYVMVMLWLEPLERYISTWEGNKISMDQHSTKQFFISCVITLPLIYGYIFISN